jgi:hypothetical protein
MSTQARIEAGGNAEQIGPSGQFEGVGSANGSGMQNAILVLDELAKVAGVATGSAGGTAMKAAAAAAEAVGASAGEEGLAQVSSPFT